MIYYCICTRGGTYYSSYETHVNSVACKTWNVEWNGIIISSSFYSLRVHEVVCVD